jgi:hypothetical protein
VHVLAFADGQGRVAVVGVDTRAQLWRTGTLHPVALAWSPTGHRLLVLTQRRVLIYDAAGRRVASRPADGARFAVWSPRAPVIALVNTHARSAKSTLVLLEATGRRRETVLFSGPGAFGAPSWAPDGRSLLLPWPAAGQWLFLGATRSGRPTAVANIARQFAPGATRPRFPGAVAWCCGQP